MQLRFLVIFIATLTTSFCISSCSQEEVQDQSNISAKGIAVYEVYRFPDAAFMKITQALGQEAHFTPFYSLEPGSFLPSTLGVTSKEDAKPAILNSLKKSSLFPEEAQLSWSKNKIYRSIEQDSFYQLYLLKSSQPALLLQAVDIDRIKASKNTSSQQIILDLQLNKEAAEEFGSLTTKVAADKYNYLAFLIDQEVYSCPSVRNAIFSGNLQITGFKNFEEAEAIAKRFE